MCGRVCSGWRDEEGAGIQTPGPKTEAEGRGQLGVCREGLWSTPPGSPGAHSAQAGLTRIVGQAARLAVKAEPPLPPGLDAAAHLH